MLTLREMFVYKCAGRVYLGYSERLLRVGRRWRFSWREKERISIRSC